MNIVLLAVTILGLALTGSFALMFRKLAAAGAALPGDGDWLDEISAGRYRPLARLLDAREYARLRAHPGCSRKMLRAFRRQRIRAFRGYVSSLSVDYGRVCHAVRSLMVDSAHDRPDLAGVLVRQRVTFTLRFMLAQFHLTLHAYGVGTVNVASLVGALDSMRLELHTLRQAAHAAAA